MKKIITIALVLGVMLPSVSSAATVQEQKLELMKQLLGLYQQLLVKVQESQVIVQVGEPASTQTVNNWQNGGNKSDYYRMYPMCGENNQFADPKTGTYNELCDRTKNPLRAN